MPNAPRSPNTDAPIDERIDAARMSFGEHLEELRTCLIRALIGTIMCAGVSLFFAKRILVFILTPAVIVLEAHGQNPSLLALSPAAPFILYLKVGFMSGLIVAMPWVLYQAWRFIGTGLYPRERRFVGRFVPVSAALFAGGVAFMFYVVLPIVLNFFVAFAGTLDLPELRPSAVQKLITGAEEPQPNADMPELDLTVPVVGQNPSDAPVGAVWVNSSRKTWNVQTADRVLGVRLQDMSRVGLVSAQYGIQFFISLVFSLAIGFGLAFELPIVVVFLAAMGIVSTAEMAQARRYVLFGIVVAAAILTPPDIISQILLAVPMYLLFEVGLLVARGFERRRPT